ncbi:MAG: polysaccharide biosynthesis/export family protein [Povalibacter sp.]|jgi:polysaccharide export outer membrane protein
MRIKTNSKISNLQLVLLATLLCALLTNLAWADGTDDYRLGPGDLIRIAVFGAPEMSSEVRVAQSGAITVPLLGAVQVAGLSTSQVEQLLAGRYSAGGYLKQPQLAVLVMEYQSQKISVLGHVTKPGQYSLRASGHVLDVLAEAGGVLAASAADHAVLTRADGSKAEIDLEKLFDGDPSQNYAVTGGDRLYVPRADQFYVYGQVQRPGMYKLERNMTVARAISASGGLTTRGTERRPIVKRRDADGKEKEYTARSTDILQPDDILVIKESLF